MERPLIFIAALRRTGSTVLAEALTQLPYSFVFVEPELCRNRFRVRPPDAARLAALDVDIDLAAFTSRHSTSGWRSAIRSLARRATGGPPALLAAFQADLLPRLAPCVGQVGVKEIVLDGWHHYIDLFPDVRVLITGRDPRDIYLSLHDRVTSGQGSWHGPLTPATVADHLLAQFRQQLEICRVADSLRVQYEQFCSAPGLLAEIKAFVRSPIPAAGEIGQFTQSNPKRAVEASLHGGRISGRRIARWQDEPDPQRRVAAQETFDRMAAYCEFWGYEREGIMDCGGTTRR